MASVRRRRLLILALCAALIYVLNRTLIIPQASEWSFFSKYLGDILALPVYIPLSMYLALKLKLIEANFELQFIHILGAVIIFSVVFEGFLPLIDTHSHADFWDILAYLLGGIILYGIYSKPGETENSNVENDELR